MNLFLSGLNHKTAPIELRERYSWTQEESSHCLDKIRGMYPTSECVLLSTCNRTEVYVYTPDQHFEIEGLEAFLCREKGLELYQMKKYLYVYEGRKAANHLFRVAAGLDSLVMGEDQILGQIRGAHQTALESKVTGGILNTLFRCAVTTAKKVKTSTGISQNSVSIGSVAIKAAEKALNGNLSDKSALVIGAGEMGKLALKNLVSRGLERIYITNRTLEKAKDLAKGYANVIPLEYDRRYTVMDGCSVVISCTESPHYTVTKELLEGVLVSHRERVFMDMAIPRDMDITIKEIPGIRFYNLDQLQETAMENMARRLEEANKAEAIISEDVDSFEKWVVFRDTLPVIQDIRNKTEKLIHEKMAKSLMGLSSATEEEKNILKASLSDTVEAVIHKFVYSIRDHGDVKEMDAYFRCIKEALKEV